MGDLTAWNPPGRGQEGSVSGPRGARSNMAGFAANVMCSCSRNGSAADSPSLLGPGSDQKKAKRRGRAFRLSRAKSRSSAEEEQPQPASNNNNTPLLIHCRVGAELKHVCSSCRGTGPLHGKSPGFASERERRPADPTAGFKRALLPGTRAVCRVCLRFWTGRDGGAIRSFWTRVGGSGPALAVGCPASSLYESTELLTIDLFFVCIRCVQLWVNQLTRSLVSGDVALL